MNAARAQLLARRELILVRIDDQRRLLGREVKALHRPLLCIELAASTWRLFSRHPGLLFGVVVAIGAWPRGKSVRVVRGGWVAWNIVRGLRAFWRSRPVSATHHVHAGDNASRTAP